MSKYHLTNEHVILAVYIYSVHLHVAMMASAGILFQNRRNTVTRYRRTLQLPEQNVSNTASLGHLYQ